MGAILVALRRIVEVAAEFADIDEHGAVASGRLAPELAGRESFANVARAADSQRNADGDDAAVGVIHRQAIVYLVGGARVGRCGEAMHDAQRARVGDARRLRQTGGAGGVDEQRRLIDRQRRPLGGPKRLGRESLDLDVDPTRAGLPFAMNEDRHRRRQLGEAGGEWRHMRGVDDRRLGADDGDRMGKRGSGEIGVDQRRRHPGARHAEPDRDIFRAVSHHQADRVALAEPLRPRPTGVAAGARVELTIGEGLCVAEQRRPVAMGSSPAFEIIAKREMAVLGDRTGAAKRPDDAARVGDLAFQSRQHADGLSLIRSYLQLGSCLNQARMTSAAEGVRNSTLRQQTARLRG